MLRCTLKFYQPNLMIKPGEVLRLEGSELWVGMFTIVEVTQEEAFEWLFHENGTSELVLVWLYHVTARPPQLPEVLSYA